jgi:competence protein ComFC
MIHRFLLQIKFFFTYRISIFIRCVFCGIPNTQVVCNYCNKQIKYNYISNTTKKLYYIDYISKSITYKSPIKDILHNLKYRQDYKYSWVLGFILNQLLVDMLIQYDYIVLVPQSNHISRNFNHLDKILEYVILQNPQLKIAKHLIYKRKNIPSQVSSKDKYSRIQNIKNAFVCKKSVLNKRFLIIDDVITTGSTSNELARVLKSSGASWVGLCTLMH